MTAEPVAAVSGLRVLRGARAVLDGVSLRLEAGTVTLLIGPNGAGKTTLLGALAGTVAAAAGSVGIGGRDPRRAPAARASVGVVPQEVALYRRLTVRENVQTFAALAGRARDGRAIAAILERTGLAEVADRLVSTLSGGMQRRADIACALVADPRLLLLDEPTVGLDPTARRAIGADLRRLADERGVAVLLATHDLDEGEAIADRVALLKAGRLVATGRPGDLLAGAFAAGTNRVEIALAGPPDPAVAGTLAARGFAPLADRSVWRGFVTAEGGATTLPTTGAMGLAERLVREVRVRRPGLADAYAALLEGAASP